MKLLIQKIINDLSGIVNLISIKGLTKALINGYSILNGSEYFAEDESKNFIDVLTTP